METVAEAGESPDIMIVDDTPDNLTLLAGMLKDHGYLVRPAPSGEVALRAAAGKAPDLFLLDISMPGMDGFEVCARLKSDPGLKDIPVIFLTAHGDLEHKIRSFELGGADYITKPFQFQEVQARVASHLALRRQRQELERNYAKLAELESLRDSLVHMLVHDLRSPLAGILGLLEFLLMEPEALAAEQRTLVEEAYKGSEELAVMVTQILDVNKLEAGKMTVAPAACDATSVARDVVKSLSAIRGGKVLSLESPNEVLPAVLDAGLVYRILQNLISNAIKFAPANGGKVVMKVERTESGVRYSVADNGIGIPAGHQASIFEKFGQVDGTVKAKIRSSGLGLPFCKLAVEAHGGQIGVVSEAGKGATFWFTLPQSG